MKTQNILLPLAAFAAGVFLAKRNEGANIGNNRKHSYRELAKRRKAGWIKFYLQDPADALTMFKYSNSDKSTEEIRSAFDTAEYLKKQYESGNEVPVSMYTPYANEIKDLLRSYSKNELSLF